MIRRIWVNLKAKFISLYHQKKNFECQQCGQEFGREYILKCHLQKHSVGFIFDSHL